MAHSPEPWKWEKDAPRLIAKDGIVLSVEQDYEYPPSKEDAERIVACVNALEGIPTEWLADPDHWFPKVLRKVAPAIAEQELRKQPYDVAKGVVVERGIAEDGSLKDVKITFSKENPMTQPRCDLCRWWDEYDKVEITPLLSKETQSRVLAAGGCLTKTIGTCHRYPPPFHDEEYESDDGKGFPWTDDSDWCGEFQPNSP